jgi:tRNA-2-methylthio-N6-dimethylallyladenosine synthase
MHVLEEMRFDTVFAAAYSPRPGTPALRMADDVPPAVKRRRLNELLARQEQIGLELNQRWLGRDVEVLVERVTPLRRKLELNDSDDDDDEPGALVPAAVPEAGEGSVPLAGRTRHNKLVHVAGDPDLVGHPVRVHIEHAGPFALRGRLVEAPDEPDVIA